MSNKDDFHIDFDFGDRPERPSQGHKHKKRKSSFSNASVVIYLFVVLGISLILSGIIIVSANDMFAFVKEDKAVVVDIPENASRWQVSRILKKDGVINYALLFDRFAASAGKHKKLKSGKYELNSNMDYHTILSTLQRVSTYRQTVGVTIPEGYTVMQVAQLLNDKLVCSKEDFLESVKTHDYNFDFVKSLPNTDYRLEGYLFPDTYEFYINDDVDNVIKKMLGNFDKKITANMRSLAKERGRTLQEIITIASLVEKEAKLDSEREKISGVIYNRLKSNKYPFLQIDAAIVYVVGQKEELTDADLKIDSPYNTYTHKGLPPGPIANPGIESILAALNPERSGYYFYVAKPDGSHIFSKTLQEHNKAVKAAEALKTNG
ncbi:MAG: endolytic transglycosylase MltG [Bacillota bacterium]|nr:endolytic transglycosylase MltG [Bacillota bacterium]